MNSPRTELAPLIEYQLLRADATRQEIEQGCAEALEHRFRSVWAHGSRVTQAVALLGERDIKTAAVVAYPFGAMDSDAKRFETEAAIDNGAQEINVALNMGWLKEREDSLVLRELRDVIEAADERDVGVMLDLALLSRDRIIAGCKLITESGAKSVIASPGFGGAAPTVEQIRFLRETLESRFAVIAAGPILDPVAAFGLREAGATRLATADAVGLMQRLE